MHITIIIDSLTILLAGYCLVVSLRYSKWLPIFISGVYLVAQIGWTTAFLAGSIWGAVLNNYVWFMFNTAVFIYIIIKENKRD